MSDYAVAFADLARDLGAALSAFADSVRPIVEQGEPGSDVLGLGLGARQQEIAELPGLIDGMRASEISGAISYDAANTHTALKALAARGVVEEDSKPGEPTKWRLRRLTGAPRIRTCGSRGS